MAQCEDTTGFDGRRLHQRKIIIAGGHRLGCTRCALPGYTRHYFSPIADGCKFTVIDPGKLRLDPSVPQQVTELIGHSPIPGLG